MNGSEKKKDMVIRIAVGVLAFIILSVWIFNLKNVWRDKSQAADKDSQWQSLKGDLEKALDEAKGKLDKFESDRQATVKKTGDDFLNGLMAEAAKKASSSAVLATSSPFQATSTSGVVQASSTPKNTPDCPEYINCMPAIGAARPCVIPAGCEGITQIAY